MGLGVGAIRPMPEYLAGWGRFPVEEAFIYRPEKVQALNSLLSLGNLTPRGLGRSYGDAALNRQGNVVDLTRLGRLLEFDEEKGLLTCEAGVSLADILEVFIPRGWFLPVTPGTKWVTVGGAIACDVHGKNHHIDSSFSQHVESLDLLLASGEVVSCSRETAPDLFWATVGGMGLTGVILRVAFRLRRIQTSYVHMKTVRVKNLDTMMETLEAQDPLYDYSVAWIDGLARGSALGRGIVLVGNHATLEELPASLRHAPLRVRHKQAGGLGLPSRLRLVNHTTVKLTNSLYSLAHRPGERLISYDNFFYPLDGLKNWNWVYGQRGLLQHQSAFPFTTGREALIQLLESTTAARYPSSLIVLKRFGRQEGILSFPCPGYTIALDFPVYSSAFLAVLEEVDSLLLKHGGRVYLAKDARLSSDNFQGMYPRWKEWLGVKQEYDPTGLFTSSLGRRLGLSS